MFLRRFYLKYQSLVFGFLLYSIFRHDPTVGPRPDELRTKSTDSVSSPTKPLAMSVASNDTDL